MPRKRTTRVFWRGARAWGDFRDLGAGREPLIAPGETMGTTDPDIAAELVQERVRGLQEQKRRAVLLGIERDAGLAEFAAEHLKRKAREGRVTRGWLMESEHQLRRAVEFFGAERSLASVKPADVRAWSTWLAELNNGRGGTLSGGTVRHHLNTLSNLFRRAQEDGCVPPGWNPVVALTDKPSAKRVEAQWLEVPDAALLLEAARTYRPKKAHNATPYSYPILATFLLTGGRKSEVLGLMAEDVSFDRGTVTFRPHEHRRLKSPTSHRSVPLFPQLREVLQTHVFERGHVDGLLFPSHQGPGMITNMWKTLDRIGERASFDAGEIRTKRFRHTYCAAALQLIDRGAPISPWTVAKWMGHGGRSLVDRIYGHLGELRHRAEVVEYRVEQHEEAVGERLSRIRLSQFLTQ